MTQYPSGLDDRFAADLGALYRRVTMLENRTGNIDSGTLIQTLTGTIDPAYTGVGNPSVQISGAASLTGPYQYLSGYAPAAGDNVLLVPSGTTYVIAGLAHATVARSQLSATTTVVNTTTETAVATLTIPAGDAVAGSVWEITAWGGASVTGTPTMTWRSRIGGVAGTAMASSGARTASSGVVGHSWRVVLDVVCLATGASGSFFGQQVTWEALSVAGGAPYVPAVVLDGTVPVTADSTVAESLVVTAQWSAASASNSLTCQGFIAERIA